MRVWGSDVCVRDRQQACLCVVVSCVLVNTLLARAPEFADIERSVTGIGCHCLHTF